MKNKIEVLLIPAFLLLISIGSYVGAGAFFYAILFFTIPPYLIFYLIRINKSTEEVKLSKVYIGTAIMAFGLTMLYLFFQLTHYPSGLALLLSTTGIVAFLISLLILTLVNPKERLKVSIWAVCFPFLILIAKFGSDRYVASKLEIQTLRTIDIIQLMESNNSKSLSTNSSHFDELKLISDFKNELTEGRNVTDLSPYDLRNIDQVVLKSRGFENDFKAILTAKEFEILFMEPIAVGEALIILSQVESRILK